MTNLSGISSKLTKNADTIGALAGAMIRGYEPIIDNIMAIFSGQAHVPDVKRTIEAYFQLPEFKPTLLLWAIGWGAKEFGYAKYGNPIQKFSEGMLKGMALQHLLWWSTHADEGSAPQGVQSMFSKVTNSGYGY